MLKKFFSRKWYKERWRKFVRFLYMKTYNVKDPELDFVKFNVKQYNIVTCRCEKFVSNKSLTNDNRPTAEILKDVAAIAGEELLRSSSLKELIEFSVDDAVYDNYAKVTALLYVGKRI